MSMTSEAKRALSSTIRALRERLLADLHDATEAAYRLSVSVREAGLSEAGTALRLRLEAWIEEQVRAEVEAELSRRRRPGMTPRQLALERERLTAELEQQGIRGRLRREVEKRAAYTLLNRLIILRLMEATKLRSPPVVSGGWESRGYKDFRDLAPALVRGDESEGYALLLQLLFEDLATDLPGLFGPAGIGELVPLPAATLRHAVEALDAPELASCWTDDMTLGWVYQYWNDPEREALDDKLHSGGKVEAHEVASKTQMFTERYLVDWLLQNSLGALWLALCARHGWTPEVVSDGTLARLEERRREWQQKRARGEVGPTELMPLYTDAERRWAFYVPQPVPADAIITAPDTIRKLKILDPAVGSGHFLVVAFDLLVALYQEEARHRGEEGQEQWSLRSIVEHILSHNLHGLDLDPRAVQIAAASLWLKARLLVPSARPEWMNLVASDLRLASLPDDDPALVELRREVERETGIPGALTHQIAAALRGADALGSLLRVDAAVDDAVLHHETLSRLENEQGKLFGGYSDPAPRKVIDRYDARATVLGRIEAFLARHTGGEDLGLRLRGEQLAAGVRFVRMVREGQYDLVVGNPPYQGTAKMADPAYVQKVYPRGKADLYAAFLERALQLARPGGMAALLTMRGWMFLKQYTALRTWLLQSWDLRALGDFDRGAFEEVPDEVVSVCASVFRKLSPTPSPSVALQPTPLDDRSRDSERTTRKRAATLAGVGRRDFRPQALQVVPGWPLCYWWSPEALGEYEALPRFGDTFVARTGMATQDNTRHLRLPHEVHPGQVSPSDWAPFIKGGEGREWLEPLSCVVGWRHRGLEMKVRHEHAFRSTSKYIMSESLYFQRGVAFCTTGAVFSARMPRHPSIISNVASTVFAGDDNVRVLCILNSTRARRFLADLNPTIHFELGDVARLPVFPIEDSERIFATLEQAFAEHEAHREPSVEFVRPGPSAWRHAQQWAQQAVDRASGAPLPPYEPEREPALPADFLSFALGVALGRFSPDGAGILDARTADLSHALPHGILFLDGTLEPGDLRDSLGQPAASVLHTAWAEHGSQLETRHKDLRSWLRQEFFGIHRAMYDNRPIHWPLSSSERTFVAWINIHRWTRATLTTLLADHLVPTRQRLEGELADLRSVRDGADPKAARAAEKRFGRVQGYKEEIEQLIALVTRCSDQGPPPADPQPKRCPPRERDARYLPRLDDGVMINSAALWPLLEPQWKEPRKWWRELALASGRRDYDWSQLARLYWPTRVDGKCRQDPSLALAHGCFWRYHPGRAWAWELRMQDEVGPDFRIEEGPYTHPDGTVSEDHTALRAAYLRDHPAEALEAVESEVLRRIGRGKARKPLPEMMLLESGLWSAHPELCWALELRVSEKQGCAFLLRAPDEAAARAALVAAQPERVVEREALLAGLSPPELFEEASEASEEVGEE